MTAPKEGWPLWLRSLDLSRFGLYTGADEQILERLQSILDVRLPREYCDFLKVSDGAVLWLKGGRVEFFPVQHVNESRVLIGRLNALEPPENKYFVIGIDDRDDDVVFRREDMPAPGADCCPVYALDHETGEEMLLARSLRQYVQDLSRLGPNDNYVPIECREREASESERPSHKAWWQWWK
jgi:hypothetical protein